MIGTRNKSGIEEKELLIEYSIKNGGKGFFQSPVYVLPNHDLIVGKTREQGIDVSLAGLVTADRLDFLKVANTNEYDAAYWRATQARKFYSGEFGFVSFPADNKALYRKISQSYTNLEKGQSEVNLETTNLVDAIKNELIYKPMNGTGHLFLK